MPSAQGSRFKMLIWGAVGAAIATVTGFLVKEYIIDPLSEPNPAELVSLIGKHQTREFVFDLLGPPNKSYPGEILIEGYFFKSLDLYLIYENQMVVAKGVRGKYANKMTFSNEILRLDEIRFSLEGEAQDQIYLEFFEVQDSHITYAGNCGRFPPLIENWNIIGGEENPFWYKSGDWEVLTSHPREKSAWLEWRENTQPLFKAMEWEHSGGSGLPYFIMLIICYKEAGLEWTPNG